MKAVLIGMLGLALLAPGCAKNTKDATNAVDESSGPRITLEDLQRNQPRRYDRKVITLGQSETGPQTPENQAGAPASGGEGEQEQGAGGDEGESLGGDEVAGEGQFVRGDESTEGGESLGVDEGDEGI